MRCRGGEARFNFHRRNLPVRGMLYGVTLQGAGEVALAALAMLIVTIAAAGFPAYRAASIDPMRELRSRLEHDGGTLRIELKHACPIRTRDPGLRPGEHRSTGLQKAGWIHAPGFCPAST
jgi:hypothetical protein